MAKFSRRRIDEFFLGGGGDGVVCFIQRGGDSGYHANRLHRNDLHVFSGPVSAEGLKGCSKHRLLKSHGMIA